MQSKGPSSQAKDAACLSWRWMSPVLTKGSTFSELCCRKVDEFVVWEEGSMGGRSGQRAGSTDTVAGVRGAGRERVENASTLGRETGCLFAMEQVFLRSFLFLYIFFISNPKPFSDT